MGSLETDRKSAHWDSYQWKLFKASAAACTVSHPSGLFPWQPLPPSTCRCWQPSEKSPQSLKYRWQGQHPTGGKPLKHHVRFQRCGARKTPSFHWRWSRMAHSILQFASFPSLAREVNCKNSATKRIWETLILQLFAEFLFEAKSLTHLHFKAWIHLNYF